MTGGFKVVRPDELAIIHADGLTAEDVDRISGQYQPAATRKPPRALKGIIGSAILIVGAIIAATLLTGCFAGKNARITGIGTGHGPQQEGASATATPAPMLSSTPDTFPGSVTVGGVTMSVPLALERVRRLVADTLTDQEPTTYDLPVRSRAVVVPTPAPTPQPEVLDRGPMAWVNPHGRKYHLFSDCPYVCRSGDARDFCQGKASNPIVPGLAIEQGRPLCITCAKRAGGTK